MKISLALLAASAVAVCGVAVAAPASAYDRDVYSYAASHMIERSDVPKALGTFKPGLSFTSYAYTGKIQLCDVPQADAQAADTIVRFPGSRYIFSGGYNGRGKNAPFVSTNVYQYANAEAAISAYGALKKGISACTGTGSNSFTDDDKTTYTYSVELTNGVVPSVTVTGVESVFVSNNSLSQTTPAGSTTVYDEYTVYTLVDDVIIATSFSSNGSGNLTTKQRKAVDQVAFNAVSRWLD